MTYCSATYLGRATGPGRGLGRLRRGPRDYTVGLSFYPAVMTRRSPEDLGVSSTAPATRLRRAGCAESPVPHVLDLRGS